MVIGRGCLGRPWLFADLEAAFNGSAERRLPSLGEVAVTMRRHAELLGEWLGEERGCIEFRKHIAWYLKGFPAGSRVRDHLGRISSYAALDELLAELDPTAPFPEAELGTPRGRTNSPGKVFLPDGWLASRDDDTPPDGAELDDSGG